MLKYAVYVYPDILINISITIVEQTSGLKRNAYENLLIRDSNWFTNFVEVYVCYKLELIWSNT